MSRRANILLALAGAGAAGYALMEYKRLHVGQQASELKLKISGVRVEDNDIVINIKVLNPTSTDMEIQSFVGSMKAGNTTVADVQMFGDYVAKNNNQITIPLIAKPRLVNLFQELRKLLGSGKAQIQFDGTINVNNHAIPLHLSYHK